MIEFLSPVPYPSADATSPGVYRGIYGMPMFVTIPTTDLSRSEKFWVDGLGFETLFAVPGVLIHLRRWAFQDVLLVPAEDADSRSSLSVSFSCITAELPAIAERCEKLVPGCADGPHERPWNSDELSVTTPEGATIVMTAARPPTGSGMPIQTP